jgi:hypothetical protein
MTDSFNQLLPEERLLLALCSSQRSESQSAEIFSLVKQVTDWDRFVTLVNKHGIIALCWYTLDKLGYGNTVPTVCIEKMHHAYLKSVARNTQIYKLLDEVLSVASKGHIRVVLLKGLALERTVYGNKGVRQMTDLDILVRREDAVRLRNLMLENGFESMPMYSPLHERIVPSYGKHLPEMYKKGLSVEIHFRLFEDKNNSLTEKFIHEAVIPFPDNADTFIPDPQFHLLFLIKHLALHESEGYSQLRLYADLLYLLSGKGSAILNESLFILSKKAGIENALSERLLLLNTFFGVELPSNMVLDGALTDREKITDKFIYFLRHPAEIEDKQEQEGILKPLKLMDKTAEKFLFILGSLFPSISFMKYRYKVSSGFIAFLFYPIRLFSLFVRLFR